MLYIRLSNHTFVHSGQEDLVVIGGFYIVNIIDRGTVNKQ